MIDIRILREEPERVRKAMIDLKAEDAPVEDAISLDKRSEIPDQRRSEA